MCSLEVLEPSHEALLRVFAAWLNSRCVSKPLLIKLLLHQTFPRMLWAIYCVNNHLVNYINTFLGRLISFVAENIPSMHVAAEYIHELLESDSASTRSDAFLVVVSYQFYRIRLFALELAAHLVAKYRFPPSYELARVLLSHCRLDPLLRIGTFLI